MRRKSPEANLQKACARYLDLTLDPERTYWTAIGHGGGGLIRGAQLKLMGVKPGVADLMICWRCGRVTFPDGSVDVRATRVGWIELKSPTGTQSPEQRDFASRMRWLYHRYAVVRSLDELIAVLNEWGVPTRAKRKAAA